MPVAPLLSGGILVVVYGILVGISPEVTEIAHELVARVVDTVVEPAGDLLLGHRTALGQRHALLLVEAGVEEEAASHEGLGGPLGGVARGHILVVLLVGHQADGGL